LLTIEEQRQMRIILILEGSGGELARTQPIEVNDETDVGDEVRAAIESEYWAFSVGDVIKIVEA
jgi:hypothetical protein